MTMTSEFIQGPTGRLEISVRMPSNGIPKGVMIVLHPNPLYGGTNQNKVVQTVSKAAANSGYQVYAPNLRGVGLSEGTHDYARGEVDDVFALYRYIEKIHPNLPISVAGFSFGGYVAIKSAQQLAFSRIILIGAAVGIYPEPAPNLSPKISCLLIHGEKDEVIPMDNVWTWARPQNLPVSVILDASHFFHGKLIPLQHFIEAFLT